MTNESIESLQTQLTTLRQTLNSLQQQSHLPSIMAYNLREYPQTIRKLSNDYDNGIINLKEFILRIDLQSNLVLRRYVTALHSTELNTEEAQ